MTTQPATDYPWTEGEWDIAFERKLAEFLRSYLNDNPPPDASEMGRDAAKWATNLEHRDWIRRAPKGTVTT